MKPCLFPLWSSAILFLAMSTSAHDGKEHKVTVGKTGLTFDPPRVSAKKGDTIVFVFYQNAHTVTQTRFKNPCSGMNPPADSFCTTSATSNNGSSTSAYPTTSATSSGGSGTSAYPTSSNGSSNTGYPTSAPTSTGGSDTSAYPTSSDNSSNAGQSSTSATSNGGSDTSAYPVTAANGGSDTSAYPKTSGTSSGGTNADTDEDDDYPSFGDPSKKPTNSSATSQNTDSDEVKGGEDSVQPTQQNDNPTSVSTGSTTSGNSSASTQTQCNCSPSSGGSSGATKASSDYPTGSVTSPQGKTPAPTCDAKCIEVDGSCQTSSDCTLQSKSPSDTKCKLEGGKCKRCGEAKKWKRSVEDEVERTIVRMARRTVDLSDKTHSQDSQLNGNKTGTLGLDSGVVNVDDSKKESGTTWKVTITDDSKPLWFMSASLNECSSGMVFAVNAPDTGDKTYNAFVKAAKSSSCPTAYPSTPHLQGDGCTASAAPCGGAQKDSPSGATATSNTYPTASSEEGKTPAPSDHQASTNSTPSSAPTVDAPSSTPSAPTVDSPSSTSPARTVDSPSTSTSNPPATNTTKGAKTADGTNDPEGKGSGSPPPSEGGRHRPHGILTLTFIATVCASLVGLVAIIQ